MTFVAYVNNRSFRCGLWTAIAVLALDTVLTLGVGFVLGRMF